MVKKLKRTIIQCLSAALMNANISGFWKGKIYTGKSKNLCLPVLNCYSCPGALGACPIGSLQVSAGCSAYGISFYVLGFLALMGVLFGRLLCGFLCPFGFIQDLLYKIPLPKLKIPKKPDRILRLGKYLVLALLVLLLPFLMADSYGSTIPYFCKYLCPAGTLEGGIPLVSMNKPLQATIGWLFSWKILILAVIFLSSVMVYRPFCKYFCPLGAFYALFNRFSFYRYSIDRSKCTNCGICSKVCQMNISPVKTPNHAECIRCGLCRNKCPQNAIKVENITQIHVMEEKKKIMKRIRKSKSFAVLLCTLLFTMLLAGCAQKKPSNVDQSTEQQEENYDYTGYTDYTEVGLNITLKLPSEYLNNDTIIPGRYEIMFGDLSLLDKDIPKAETDPSDHLDLFFMPLKGEYCLFKVLAYPSEKWDGWMNSGKKATDITDSAISEEICRKDGIVYIYDQPIIDTSAFDSDMKADYDEIMKMLPAIKASIKPTTVTVGDLGEFSANDLNGEAVDNSIFSGYKLTMINIWATFCKPCIKELPDLQEMSKDMPEGTQLISIIGDIDDDESLKLAKEIAEDTGVSFISIVPDTPLKQYLDDNIVAYPTTLFVDSEGKIVGEAIIGERDMSVYKEVLNDRLTKADSQNNK